MQGFEVLLSVEALIGATVVIILWGRLLLYFLAVVGLVAELLIAVDQRLMVKIILVVIFAKTWSFIIIGLCRILNDIRLYNNLRYSEPYPTEFDDVVELCFVAELAELIQWQPDFSVRRFLILLVDLVGVVGPVFIIFMVNQYYFRVEV